MSTRSRTASARFDVITGQLRWLAVLHFALGILAAFAYWTRPTWLHGAIWARGYGYSVLIKTFLAWGPLLVSWLIARRAVVESRGPAVVFAVVLVAVSLLVDAILVGIVSAPQLLTPVVLSLGQTAVFAFAAVLYRGMSEDGIYE